MWVIIYIYYIMCVCVRDSTCQLRGKNNRAFRQPRDSGTPRNRSPQGRHREALETLEFLAHYGTFMELYCFQKLWHSWGKCDDIIWYLHSQSMLVAQVRWKRERERERETIGSRVHFFNTEMHKTDVHRFTHTHTCMLFFKS